MDPGALRTLFGTDEVGPPEMTFRAGRFALRLCGTRLLAIDEAGHEVWHGVAFLYRDEDWGTPEPVIESVEHEQRPDGFRALVRAQVPVDPPIDLRITIDANADGHVRYEGLALPRGEIGTNRTGLCVTYPQSLAGRPVEVLHDDGRRSRSTFPRRIAPWPPFLGVRALRHGYGEGGLAECRFEGDVFEFEDQRNNADASYKVYNRSNLMPRPYRLRAGQAVRQAVELSLLRPSAPREASAVPLIRPPAAPQRREPFELAIGIGITPDDACADAQRLDALRLVRPAQLQLRLAQPDEPVDWPGVARLLQAADARLRIDLLRLDESGAAARLRTLASALAQAGIEPAAVAVFPSSPPVVEAARVAFPGSAIGGGTRWFFTQLNRIEELGAVDFLSFTTGSLVHGADDASVMSGLASLPAMIQTLAARHPGLPVRVGPSAIGSRGSPLGAQPAGAGTRRQALARSDPRSQAVFGAAWLLGHVAAFAGAGAAAVSVMHLSGDDALTTPDGRPCPAAFVLQRLRAASALRRLETGAAQRVVALAAGQWLLVANLGGEPVEVGLALPLQEECEILDAASWEGHAAGGAPSPWRPARCAAGLVLPPYATAALQLTTRS